MSNNKGDKDMQAVSEDLIDTSVHLSPAQVKAYVEPRVHGQTGKTARMGHIEFNNGMILVKSKKPLEECQRRGIIEDQHYEAGRRFQSYRDCALSVTSGRVYNAPGEGDPDMDAGTIYANVLRYMSENESRKNQWKLISIICFAEPNIDGVYLSEADYAALCRLAPNIQYAFEISDEAFTNARKVLRAKLDQEKKKKEEDARLRD
jgi:hypothetical protein